MNQMKIFKNPEFGNDRVIDEDGKYLFCGTDVARVLGYSIPSKAVNTHCKGVSKMEAPTTGGVHMTAVFNISGYYDASMVQVFIGIIVLLACVVLALFILKGLNRKAK